MKLTIIGAGPGGYSAAFAAAKAGVDVTLVERAKLGGTCLHTGCIPTKTLRSSAANAAHTCPVHLSLHPDVEQVFTFHWKR